MKSDWKKFVASLPYEVEFLHKDEFKTTHVGHAIQAPALISSDSDQFTTLISTNDFSLIESLEELKIQVTNALKSLQ